MTESSPARLYAGVVGAALVAVGIIGFFYNADFSSDPADRAAVFGLLDTNAWGNLSCIVVGLLGLIAFTAGPYASRYYALGVGDRKSVV